MPSRFVPTIEDPGAETVMVLNQLEWSDLAYICGVWRRATEEDKDYTPEELAVVIRRRALADRVVEAA